MPEGVLGERLPLHLHGPAEVDLLDDAVQLERVRERAADPHVLRRKLEVIHRPAAPLRARVAAQHDAVEGVDAVELLVREPGGHVDRAGLERRDAGSLLLDDLEVDVVQALGAAPRGGAREERDLGARHVVAGDVGAAADGLLGLELLALRGVLEDVLGEHEDEVLPARDDRVRLRLAADRRLKPDGERVDDLGTGDGVDARPQARLVVGVAVVVEGELDVLGGDLDAVGELGVADREDPLGRVARCGLPAGREGRDDGVGDGVEPRQRVVDGVELLDAPGRGSSGPGCCRG